MFTILGISYEFGECWDIVPHIQDMDIETCKLSPIPRGFSHHFSRWIHRKVVENSARIEFTEVFKLWSFLPHPKTYGLMGIKSCQPPGMYETLKYKLPTSRVFFSWISEPSTGPRKPKKRKNVGSRYMTHWMSVWLSCRDCWCLVVTVDGQNFCQKTLLEEEEGLGHQSNLTYRIYRDISSSILVFRDWRENRFENHHASIVSFSLISAIFGHQTNQQSEPRHQV